MVLQDGGRNEAAVSQEGDDNQSFVVQQGISNSTGNAGTSTGIMQIGDDNFSSVNQAPSNNAKATVAQTGNANQSSVAQTLALTRSEEHTSELQSLMHISYAVFCLKKKNSILTYHPYTLSFTPTIYTATQIIQIIQ